MKKSEIKFDFWACQRPLTRHWGSGDVINRISDEFGVPDSFLAIDHNTGYEWNNLPFDTNKFKFGYWDPPYDRMYKSEGIEIWRVVKKIAILHTHIWPISWLKDAHRIGMIGVTMGPLKRIRCLQVFKKNNGVLDV